MIRRRRLVAVQWDLHVERRDGRRTTRRRQGPIDVAAAAVGRRVLAHLTRTVDTFVLHLQPAAVEVEADVEKQCQLRGRHGQKGCAHPSNIAMAFSASCSLAKTTEP